MTTISSESVGALIIPLPLAPVGSGASFDGVAELLRLARESNLTVFGAVDVTLTLAADELPASREHVVYQHPEWLMVPREIAPEMLKVDSKSPAYLGQLARWARANGDRVKGVYVSPLDPAAAVYLANAIAAAVRNYAVDGIYLEGVAFPDREFDYSRHTMDVFKAHKWANMSLAERSRLDAIEGIDPFAYPEEFPDEWARFRESALTGVLERVRASLVQPSFSISADVGADAEVSLREHFQDWRSWLDRGLVDRVGHGSPADTAVLLSAGTWPADRPERLSSAAAPGGTR